MKEIIRSIGLSIPHRKHIASPLQAETVIAVRTLQETHCVSSTRSVSEANGRTDYEEREVGSSERHYGWEEQNLSSVLKVPRHCPFVLLVSVSI
jgi:hypothetical protein